MHHITPARALITLYCVGLFACGAQDDQDDQAEQSNQWTVIDDPVADMSRMSTHDMRTSAKDMSSMALDFATDMPTAPLDMVQGLDLPVMPDIAPDMIDMTDMPRVCADTPFERIEAPRILTAQLRNGFGVSVQEHPCGDIAHTRQDSYTLHIKARALIDIWTEPAIRDGDLYDSVLILEDECEPLAAESILACGGRRGPRVSQRAASIRQVFEPGDYALTVAERVDPDNPFALGGRYTLHVNEVLAAVQGTCGNAGALQPGQRLVETNDQGAGDQGPSAPAFRGAT